MAQRTQGDMKELQEQPHKYPHAYQMQNVTSSQVGKKSGQNQQTSVVNSTSGIYGTDGSSIRAGRQDGSIKAGGERSQNRDSDF